MRLLFSFFLCQIAFGQVVDNSDVRCSPYTRECIDITQAVQDTINIPINNTRFETDGFKICYPSDDTVSGAVNIVIAVDQSGSMNGDKNDPNFLAPVAITEAFNEIYARSPESNVGFLAFAAGLCDGTPDFEITANKGAGPRLAAKGTPASNTLVPPAPISNQPHRESLLFQSAYNEDDFYFHCGTAGPGKTWYFDAFDTAQKWLENPSLPSNNEDIIIFITDGKPTQQDGPDFASFVAMVEAADSTNFPTVYAIFIGDTEPRLIELTEKTGGRLIEIENGNAIENAMAEIIDVSINVDPPQASTIQNSNGSSSIMTSQTQSTSNPQEYQVILENLITLNEGLNTLSISTTTAGGQVLQTTVPINVSLAAETRTGDIEYPSIILNSMCEDKASLEVTDASNTNSLTSLPEGVSNFNVVLNTSSEAASTLVSAQIPNGDAESLTLLPGSNNTYIKPDSISTSSVAPQNGNLDVAGATVINFGWVNPLDPRDNASFTLNLTSDASIYFTNLEGDPISSLSDLSDNQFIVVLEDISLTGTQQVNLTSSDGDVLSLTLTETPGVPGVFTAAVPFAFTGEVIPSNASIEGLLDLGTSSNSTEVTAEFNGTSSLLTLVSSYVLATQAWIIDGDGDNRADSVFIEFENDLPLLPDSTLAVFWPSGDVPAVNPLTAAQISLLPGSNNIVVIDFSQNPFELGETAALIPDPNVVLPAGPAFQNQQVIITDRVQPGILSAEILATDGDRYIIQDSAGIQTTYINPDTLRVTFTEALFPENGVPNFDSVLFITTVINGVETVVPLTIHGTPIISDDSTTWLILILSTDSLKPDEGDIIMTHSEAGWTDAATNHLSSHSEEITGTIGEVVEVESFILDPIVGDDNIPNVSSNNNDLIPVYNEAGELIDQIPPSSSNIVEWIPPVYMNEFGVINEQAQLACDSTSQFDNTEPQALDPNCLSIVTVFSEGSYVAEVGVYDNLGKFLHASTQRFGSCGELDNDVREQPAGIASFLIWNQRDLENNLVGSGVYLWQVKFTLEDGSSFVANYKQGVARSQSPSLTCAAGN